MTAVEFLPGVGKATHCVLADVHTPVPLRFVWHHILPQVCGGKTTAANLASVCDNCHYATHVLMWLLANGGIPTAVKGSAKELSLAERGYTEAVAAGTANKMPKEAGAG